jgi:hypothetical protein
MTYKILYNILSKEIVGYGDSVIEIPLGYAIVNGVGTYFDSYVSNGVICLYTDSQRNLKLQIPGRGFVWSNYIFEWVSEFTEIEQYNIQETSVKSIRDSLLYESDWTQIPNNPLTEQQQTEWVLYRQQLRDVTSQSGYPFNVVWPTQPQG